MAPTYEVIHFTASFTMVVTSPTRLPMAEGEVVVAIPSFHRFYKNRVNADG